MVPSNFRDLKQFTLVYFFSKSPTAHCAMNSLCIMIRATSKEYLKRECKRPL